MIHRLPYLVIQVLWVDIHTVKRDYNTILQLPVLVAGEETVLVVLDILVLAIQMLVKWEDLDGIHNLVIQLLYHKQVHPYSIRDITLLDLKWPWHVIKLL